MIIYLPGFAVPNMMIFKRFPSTRLLIMLALLTILVLAVISFTRINRMNDLSTQVNHANLIKLKLQETYSDLSDADSEISKYILTLNPAYRKRMLEFQQKVNGSIRDLKVLTVDRPAQLRKVITLDSLIQIRFDLMQKLLPQTQKDYEKITSDITRSNDEIVSFIHILKGNEDKWLEAMSGPVERHRSLTHVTLFIFKLVVIGFLIFAYFRTDRELKLRRDLQKELESQVQFIRAILDNSVDIVLVLDTRSNLVMANKKSIEMLSITDDMIGRNIWDLFPIGKNSKSHHAIVQALTGEYVYIEKHRAHSIDLTLESFFIPLRKEGKVTAVMMIHHDISALVKANEALEISNERLRKSNEDLDQFAYIASHDLQEPLRKVLTYADLADKSKTDPEKLSGYLARIKSSAGRMSDLIRDVLQYSRSVNPTSTKERVDLNNVVAQVIQDLELTIEEKGAILNTALLPVVDGHRQQLSQVLFNLLHNALKFCDRQPVITIGCRAENGFYHITVGDNGIGFEPAYKDQIFEIFRRIPNQRNYSGTGIGLAICKKIVTHHGGTITVESEPGKGTTFEIRLPVTAAPLVSQV